MWSSFFCHSSNISLIHFLKRDLQGAEALIKCSAFESAEPEDREFVIEGLCRFYIRNNNMHQLYNFVQLLSDKKQCDELIDYVRKNEYNNEALVILLHRADELGYGSPYFAL